MQNAQVTVLRAVAITIVALAMAGYHLIRLTPAPSDPSTETSARGETQLSVGFIRIDVAEAKALFDAGAAQFIDARKAKAFRAAHIPGAMHLPFAAFSSGRPEQVDTLLPELPTVIYCSSQECHSSELVAKQLVGQGFEDVQVLEGGYPAWADAGYPLDGR